MNVRHVFLAHLPLSTLSGFINVTATFQERSLMTDFGKKNLSKQPSSPRLKLTNITSKIVYFLKKKYLNSQTFVKSLKNCIAMSVLFSIKLNLKII